MAIEKTHDKVITMWRRDGTAVEVDCGSYWAGVQQLCKECLERAMDDFPQGWVGYPGDVCKHGKYTGGSGVDHMCFFCEMGVEEDNIV